MLNPKGIADLITLIRVLMGVFLAWLGFNRGPESLPQAIVVMTLCWAGDFLDGKIARLSQPPRHSWIGDNDLFWDVFVSLGLGVYLVGAGFIEWYVACIYLVIWGVLLLRFGLDGNLLMLVQAFIYFCFVWVALSVAPQFGRWMVALLFLITIINWRRFSTQVVPKFIHGMKEVWRSHNPPDNP